MTNHATEKDRVLTHKYAEVNGVRLHYVTAGKGKLMLFLHGFPEFWYEWKDQLAAFSSDYQVVAPDMRGYNLSSKPAGVEQYRIETLVEDIHALVEHLGHQRFILVGHDWGGGVAWAFAKRYPEQLEQLILVNSPHPLLFNRQVRENPAQTQASQYIVGFRQPEAEQIYEANQYELIVKSVLQKGLEQGTFTEEDRNAYIEAWSQPGALTGGLNYYRATRVGPPAEDDPEGKEDTLARYMESGLIDTPTLVIWGEQDEYILTGNLEGLEKLVPNVLIKYIADGTHWVVHEQAELVNSYIREFLKQR